MKIKICGIATEEGLAEILALRPDYLGFIFYPSSLRCVSVEKAKKLSELCEGRTERVLVFRNAELVDVLALQQELHAEVLQLHGEEDPAYLQALRRSLPKARLWKAIPVDTEMPVEHVKIYKDVADALVFDTASIQGGGSGQSFDWELLGNYEAGLPFFLSGGIGLDALAPLRKFLETHPRLAESLAGIDVNSRFELSPGKKNPQALAQLFSSFRSFHEREGSSL